MQRTKRALEEMNIYTDKQLKQSAKASYHLPVMKTRPSITYARASGERISKTLAIIVNTMSKYHMITVSYLYCTIIYTTVVV